MTWCPNDMEKIKEMFLLSVLGCLTSLNLFAQAQNATPILEPEEVITFRFTHEQINFWLDAEDYIARQLKSGIDIYSPDFYTQASTQEKAWLDSIDSGNSPYITDYRSRYWGSNWSYASSLITQESDSLAYDFNLLTPWRSQKISAGIGEKIRLVFEPTGYSRIKKVMLFPGNMRTPADWERYGRPELVKLTINGKEIAILRLQNKMACQVFGIPMTAPYDEHGNLIVEFEILSVYPGNESKETAISEINFDGTNIL